LPSQEEVATYVLDSFAVLAYLANEPAAPEVRKLLETALADGGHLFMSVVNVGEVFYRYYREHGRASAEEALRATLSLPVRIVDADLALTHAAAELKATHAVAYADCFAAALARRLDATLVTGDPEFRKLGKLVKVKWL
jgi:predicted nucleic acid-binding protein